MKPIFALVLILSAVTLGGCSSFEKHGSMIAAAKDTDERFVAAFNKANVDAVMQNYWNNPDLVVVAPNGALVTGWDGTRGLFTKMFADMPGAKIEMSDQQYRVEGNTVYAWGNWKITVPSTPPQELRGRYTELLARRDHRMVYILDHPAMIIPPPPTASTK